MVRLPAPTRSRKQCGKKLIASRHENGPASGGRQRGANFRKVPGVSQAIEVFRIVVDIIALPPREFSRRYYRGSACIDCPPAAGSPRSLQSKSLQSRSSSIRRNSAWHVARLPFPTYRHRPTLISLEPERHRAPSCPGPPTPLNSFIVFHGKFGNESRRAAPNDTTQFSGARGSRCSYRQIRDTKNQAPLNFFDTNYEVGAAPRVDRSSRAISNQPVLNRNVQYCRVIQCTVINRRLISSLVSLCRMSTLSAVAIGSIFSWRRRSPV